jgi:hypothetical protein
MLVALRGENSLRPWDHEALSMMQTASFNRLLTAACAALALTLTACGESPTAPRSVAVKRTNAATALAAHPAAVASSASIAHPVTTAVAKSKVVLAPATPPALVPAPVAPAPADGTAAVDNSLMTANSPIAIEMNGASTGSTSGTINDASAGTASALAASAITAEIVDQKNGVLFGMGAYKCTVQVTNNSATPKSGLLKLTFMNGTKFSKTAPAVQLVTLAPNETQTLPFVDKLWSTDSAVVSVAETQPGQPMAAFVTTKKNGVFLGLGAYKCTVEVINPDVTVHTATLVVSFTHGGGKASVTAPVRTSVTLQPNTAQSFDFSDPKWSTNDVTATLE